MKYLDKNNSKHSGFRVPQDYFDSFDEQVMSHIRLKDTTDHTGFSVPDYYFETLDDKIMAKTKTSGKVISLFSRKSVLYISSIAASLILVLNVIDFGSKTSYDTLSLETVEDYILSEDLDNYELADLFDEDELSDEFFDTMNFDAEAIEDYVDDYIELDDLYTE